MVDLLCWDVIADNYYILPVPLKRSCDIKTLINKIHPRAKNTKNWDIYVPKSESKKLTKLTKVTFNFDKNLSFTDKKQVWFYKKKASNLHKSVA